MENLKLVSKVKSNDINNRVKVTQSFDAEYMVKTFGNILKSIEKLEDRLNDLEHKLKVHINTLDPLVHKL